MATRFNDKRKCFIAVYFILISTFSFAYDIVIKVADFGEVNYSFSLSKFIDARLNAGKPVGFTRIGISNKPEELRLPHNFAMYCDSVFHSGDLKYNNALNLIPVINQITIQETHDGGKEYSTVSLSVDYYLSNDPSCSLYYSSYIRISDQSGWDITKKHARNLSYAFFKSFQNLQKFIDAKESVKSKWTTNLSLLRDSVITLSDKVAQNSVSDGIYFSCKQLLDNKPSTDYPELLATIDTAKNTIEFTPKTSFFLNNSAFAIVKNHVVYIQIRNLAYQKAQLESGTRLAYYKNLTRRNSNVGAGLASVGLGMFGFVGAVTGSLIKSATSKYETIDKLYIDLETGLIDIMP